MDHQDATADEQKQNTQMGQYDSVCVKVINDKEQVIASQKYYHYNANRRFGQN